MATLKRREVYGGEVQGGLALLVLHGWVGAMGEQQGTELRAALLGCLVERREGPLVCRIHTCVVLDEQRRNVHVLQGREAVTAATNLFNKTQPYSESINAAAIIPQLIREHNVFLLRLSGVRCSEAELTP